MTTIQMVLEFHETFGHPIGTKPQIPSKDQNDFRSKFMEEESKETMLACEQNNLIELADGLGDLQYVLDGWFVTSGLQDYKDRIVGEIHRSNMTKMCQNEKEAMDTLVHINKTCKPEDKVSCRWSGVGSYYVIFRIRDNKIQKSINYQKPDLSFILENVNESKL